MATRARMRAGGPKAPMWRSLRRLVAVAATNAGGANQAGVRLYNERLLLSLVRRFGPLSKIEVARLTGLSVQSTSAIMNRLQADGLAEAGGSAARPGRTADDPDVARSRRRLFVRAQNRAAQLRSACWSTSAAPFASAPAAHTRFRRRLMILDFVRNSLPSLSTSLTAAQKRRIAGLGVAAPFQLWNWEAEIGAPPGAMNAWRHFDAESEIAAVCPYPTTLCNDATAACAAEFFFGRCWRYRDFLYFFIGEFLGGGLVLDGALRPGRTGNAAALGSMPIMAKSVGGAAPQLIACASIYQLERRTRGGGN